MPDITANDIAKRELLTTAHTIAIVGHSPKHHRPSYQVAQFLRNAGYTVFPVNPGIDSVDGLACYPTLSAIPTPVDIVAVFRRSEFLPDIVEATLDLPSPALWLQLGIIHPQALQRALDSEITVVVDRCIKLEHQRLMS